MKERLNIIGAERFSVHQDSEKLYCVKTVFIIKGRSDRNEIAVS